MEVTDELKVGIVAVICLLSMFLISDKITGGDIDFFSMNVPLLVFVIYVIIKNQRLEGRISEPILWISLTILATLAIIGIYST